jgi:hypothetical protein
VILRITAVIVRPISGSAIGRPERDNRGGGDHSQADAGVGASVVAVSDEDWAVEAVTGAEPHRTLRLPAGFRIRAR